MTPQLQQAIKLLQLSNIELGAFVEAELERNPILERTGDEGTASDAHDATSERLDGSAADGFDNGPSLAAELDQVYQRGQTAEEPASRAADDGFSNEPGATSDPLNDLDTDYANVDPDGTGSDRMGAGTANDLAAASEASSWASLGSGGAGGFGSDDDNLEGRLTAEASLRDHLQAQLALAKLTRTDRLIGEHLIDLVDDAGYLRGETWAVAEQLGCEVEDVDAVLGVLHGFEPTGVAARDLVECLRLQLIARDRYDPVMAQVLDNLHLLARHDIA